MSHHLCQEDNVDKSIQFNIRYKQNKLILDSQRREICISIKMHQQDCMLCI